MNNLIKYKVIIPAILMFFTTHSIAGDRILPLPKPQVTKEIKKSNLHKKFIYPQNKPLNNLKSKKIEKEISNTEDIIITDNENEKKAFIYPEKKPIIVQKKVEKTPIKSTVLSKKDFEIAKITFELINKKKWKAALKTSKKARDKVLYNLVNYIYLKQPSNQASFYDYTTFIDANPDFPRINRLRYLAEHKININTNTPISIIKWFNGEKPLSDFGKIKLGEVYLLQDKVDEGSKLIKEGWIKAKLTKNDLRYLRKKYKKSYNNRR